MLLRTPNLKKRVSNNQGQILVEYLLLLVIAIACATLITNALIKRGDDGNRGVIVKQWDKIIHILGNDVPDCAKQKDFKTANCPP